MPLPIFFTHSLAPQNGVITLEEDTSRHVAQVLRMKAGEQLQLTDGSGNLLTAGIVTEHKKSTQVKVLSVENYPPPVTKTAIAISPVKNAGRFEWFLEKATELGISEIIPLLCERTEKQHFKPDRMKNILASAMLQSRQVWMPKLHEPKDFKDVIEQFRFSQKFIAHCLEDSKAQLKDQLAGRLDALVLIGPEGDFTRQEIDFALQHRFHPVSLGNTRLRTETAGMAAAVVLKTFL